MTTIAQNYTPNSNLPTAENLLNDRAKPRPSRIGGVGALHQLMLLLALLALLAGTFSARADKNPPGCTGSGLGISLFTSLPDVHIGDTIFYSVLVFNTPFPACNASEVQAWIVTPDGVSNNIVLVRTTLLPGDSDYYTNVVRYVVRAQDIQPDGTVRATANDEGNIHQNDTNSRGGGNQGVNTEVNLPCIQLAVQCTGSTGENGLLTFTGTVTNCGNNTLVGVTVTNFVNNQQFTVVFPTNLAIGQSTTFSGSWVPANPCGPSTVTLVAIAVDQFTSTPRTVTSSATTTCSEILSPGIRVTKACPAVSVSPGALLVFSGTVSNTGNVTLTNILVVDNQPVANTTVFTRASLAVGEVVAFTGSYSAPTNCSVSDTLVAQGTSRCGVLVSSTASVTCPITTTPQVAVTASCPAAPVAPGGLLTYTGTVRNSGNITLVNVVVVSDRPAANTTVFTAATLAPGASGSFTGSYTAPATGCSVTANLRATGNDQCTGIAAANTFVSTCPIATAPAIAVTLACPDSSDSAIDVAQGHSATQSGTYQNGTTSYPANLAVDGNTSGQATDLSMSVTTSALNSWWQVDLGVERNVRTIKIWSRTDGGFEQTSNLYVFVSDSPIAASLQTALNQPGVTAYYQPGAMGRPTSIGINRPGRYVQVQLAGTGYLALPEVQVYEPALIVTNGGPITYTGTVLNSGNVTLNNVTVVNNHPAPNTVVLTLPSLAAGASANFSASFTTPLDVCSVSSTVSASGSDACSASNVVSSTSASCPLLTTPRLIVTENCPAASTSPGGLLTYTGSVSNGGNITLTNVLVINDRSGATPVFTAASLAPGASSPFTGSYVVPANNGCAITATLTATANDRCTGTPVATSATATCPVQGAPNVAVTLACPPTPTPLGGLLTFSGTVSNSGNVVLTNVVVATNQSNAGPFTFGTIRPPLAPPAGSVADRFGIGNNFNGLTYADQDEGYAATEFYSLRHENSGSSTFVTINASGTVTGRFDAGNRNFDALAFAGPDVGYGPVIFYFLRHDVTGLSTFGTIKPGGAVGVVADLFVVGNNFDALTFAATDVGFGPNKFYYLRHDNAGRSTFGTINPALPGTTTDRFSVGFNFDALVFTATDVGYGPNLFYYLRHDSLGVSTFGTISATGTVTDRFVVGNNFNELTFTTTDVGFGANLFYFLRGGSTAGPQPVFSITSLAPGATANFSGSYTVPSSNACSITTSVSVSANGQCAGIPASASASVTCPLVTTPLIVVAQTCPANPASPGGFLASSGSVSNAGNITLSNITVVSSQPAPNTVVFTLASLAPGASASFNSGFTAPLDACSATSTLTATGRDQCTGNTVNNSVTTTCPLVTAPQIVVTKACPIAPVTEGGLLVFTGTVTNTGNITLNNVFVVNNRPVANTAVIGPLSLAPHTGVTFSGSYSAPLNTCTVTDTLTATGADKCTGSTVANSTTTTCPIITIPRIAVTLACPAVPSVTGGPITYTGTVNNPGNVTLNNVTVIDGQAVPNTVVLTLASLAPGASANFTASFTAPPDACSVSSTVVARGSDACDNNAVSSSASATCSLITAPRLTVTQNCPTGPASPGGLLTYSGSISNAGNITLTNVVVTSDRSGATPVFTAPTLAPGAFANFTGSYTVPTNSGCAIASTLTGSGYDKCTGARVTAAASSSCPLLTTPLITVTQVCPVTLVPPGGLLTYSGIVRNAGNVTLTNIIVTDNRPASNTVIFTTGILAPGGTTNFTGSYQVPLNCCVVFSTVDAAGADTCTGAIVTDTFTTTCTVLTVPRIVVTKVCPPTATQPGQMLQYSGTVSNAGNITLVNVTIVNNQPSVGSPIFGPITLAPGESVSYYASYLVTPDFCGTDTVTARGQDACTFAAVLSSATTTCPIITSPRIAVTKNCPPQPTPKGGVFTFSGTVSNPGNVTLTNIYVVNNQPSINTPVIGPITLAPGAFANFTGSYLAPSCCCVTVDTLTARGQDRCVGTLVTSTATALCPLLTTPRIVVTRVCPAASVPVGGLFTYTGSVSNAGDVVLTNVLVVSSQPNANTPVLGPIDLAPGEAKSFSGSFIVAANSSPTSGTVTARGTDSCQGRIVTATANCSGPLTPLMITSVRLTNGVATVTWTAMSGTTYRLQSTTNWQNTNWNSIPGDVTATGPTASKNDATGAAPKRFYRVMVP